MNDEKNLNETTVNPSDEIASVEETQAVESSETPTQPLALETSLEKPTSKEKPSEEPSSEESSPVSTPVEETSAEVETAQKPGKEDVVKEELTTEEKVETDADARAAAIDEMEKASQKALDAMREAGNAKNDEVIDEAEKKLNDIFTQFKEWMQTNSHPERVKAEMKQVSDSVTNLLNKTRDGVIEVSQSEQFKQTMESGKDFVIGTGAMIADGLQHGYDKLLEIPEFKKAANFVEEKVDDLRRSETLKTLIDRSQEGINQLNNTIFSGLKAFFSPAKDTKPTSTPTTTATKVILPDLPEDPDESETSGDENKQWSESPFMM